MATSAYLGLNLIDKGAQANEWGTITNDNLSAVDAALGARHTGDPTGVEGLGLPNFQGAQVYENTNHRLYIAVTSATSTASSSYKELAGIQGFNATAADGYIYYASGASASISAGNIGLTGAVKITGQTTIDSKLHAKADVSIGGNLIVDNASVSILTVTKDASVSGYLAVGGSVSVGGDFRVGGTASLDGKLVVSASSYFKDAVLVSGTFDAAGFTYPVTDGTAGDVIITNGAGALTLTDPDLVDIPAEKNSSFVLASADQGGLIRASAAATLQVTLPASASVGLVGGFQCVVVQKGAGQVKLIAGSGVTLDTFNDLVLTAGSHVGLWVVKEGNDIWGAYGDLV